MIKTLKVRFDLDDPRDRNMYDRLEAYFKRRQISVLAKNLLCLFCDSEDDCPVEKIENYKMRIIRTERSKGLPSDPMMSEGPVEGPTYELQKASKGSSDDMIKKEDVKKAQKCFLGKFASFNPKG